MNPEQLWDTTMNPETRILVKVKMEDAIKKIPGVNDAVVSFMTQKMTIDAEDERFEEIMDEVVKTCAKVEPDCRILR